MLGLGYVDQRGDEVLKKAATVALAKIGSVLSARHELSSRHRSRSLARTESDFRRTPCPWSIYAPRSEPRSGSRSPISTSKGAKPSVSFGRFNLVLWITLAWWSVGANCAGLSAFSAPTALFRPSPPSAIRRAVRICCAIFKHNYPSARISPDRNCQGEVLEPVADFRWAAATFRTGDGGTPPKLLVMHAEVSEGAVTSAPNLRSPWWLGSQKDEENQLRRISVPTGDHSLNRRFGSISDSHSAFVTSRICWRSAGSRSRTRPCATG
jgi:hypothetical protein